MEQAAFRAFEGRLTFYHPTAAGTGCAVQFELRAARRGKEGCVFAELAAQKSAAVRDGGGRHGATFDWDAGLAVKLGLADVCALLLVLEGKAPSAGGEKGLYHQTDEASTMIGFRRIEEPTSGYVLEVSRKSKQADGTPPTRLRIVLTEAEACGLRNVLSTSVFHLCFYTVPANAGASVAKHVG